MNKIDQTGLAIAKKQLTPDSDDQLALPDRSLVTATTEVFFSTLQAQKTSIEFVAHQTPLEDCLGQMKTFYESDKEVLFIPLVIKGYNNLQSSNYPRVFVINKPSKKEAVEEEDFTEVTDESSEIPSQPSQSLLERVAFYFKGFIHFLRGGSFEDHIILITVKKGQDGELEIEYYDPKGRPVSELSWIEEKEVEEIEEIEEGEKVSIDLQPMTKYMTKLKEKVEELNPNAKINITYPQQGRLAADQSIFNKNECGFLVIRHALMIAELDEKDKNISRDISKIAARALEVIAPISSRPMRSWKQN